jgi:hypothetical protein
MEQPGNTGMAGLGDRALDVEMEDRFRAPRSLLGQTPIRCWNDTKADVHQIGDQLGRDAVASRNEIGSHGCVAFQNYQPFLKAFKRGHVTMLVVVPELPSSRNQLAVLIARPASDRARLQQHLA